MSSFLMTANGVRSALKDAQSFFTQLTGADDPASKGAARALARSIRKQLSIKAMVERRSFGGSTTRNERSQPGQAPRQVTGGLLRSTGSEIVGGITRVGVASFKGRLLEEGVDTTVNVTNSGRAFGKRRRKAGKARRTLIIARRPFMEKALEEALPKMEDFAVGELQKRGNALPVGP